MFHKIVLLLLLIVIVVIFYFSWLPDPSFGKATYLPKWLLNWSNHYYNLRTAIPFIALGFLLEFYTNTSSNVVNHNENLNFLQNIGIATIIVFIAEGGQLIIQKRSPDLMDIFYGIIGSITGALIYSLFKKIKKCEIDINLHL